MIKLFRNLPRRQAGIRKNLINQDKTARYFKYAIGEIILVVIGILIALQLNNWNQNRVNNLQATNALQNLKTELQKNIIDLEDMESRCEAAITSTTKGIEILNGDFTVKDLIQTDTLIDAVLSTFPVTKSTFEELINTGNFYNLKNETLKSEIISLYMQSEDFSAAFNETNDKTLTLRLNSELFNHNYVLDQLKSPSPNLKNIDTLWIHNKNSSTFLALYNKALIIKGFNNTIKGNCTKIHLKSTKNLLLSIEKELNSKTNNTNK
jgi:hypothetical protein